MKRLGLISALVISLSACGKNEPDLPSTAEFPSAGEASKTIIRAVGDNARVLRYTAKVGDKSEATMNVDMSIGGDGIDVDFKMLLEADVVIDEVDDKGIFKQSMTVTSATVKFGGELAQTGADTAPMAEAIKGSKMSFRMDNQGRVLGADLGGLDNPIMGQMRVGMNQALQGGVVPFPTDPVGVGAQWDALTTVAMMGVKTRIMASYKLVELNGDKGTLEFTLKGKADSQTMDMAGAGKVDLKALAIDAEGRVGFDLANPTAGNVAMKLKMSMDVTAQAQNVAMKMGIGIKMTTK